MKLKIPERDVMKSVAEYLGIMERMGKVVFWTRVNSGLVRTGNRFIHLARKGTPDYLGCLADGRFFGIECKGSNGKATPEQLETLIAIKRTGAIGVLAYSVDDIERAFAE